MVSCVLCLQEEDGSATPSARHIAIFSGATSEMEISAIISKHFWLQLDAAECPEASICRGCWTVLHEFHCFYERIVNAHDLLKSKQTNISIADNFDPLPADTDIKYRQSNEQPLIKQKVDFFDAEVKVEVNDLELLPQVEIIEGIVPTAPATKCEQSLDMKNNENLQNSTAQLNESPKCTDQPVKRGRGRPKNCIQVRKKKRVKRIRKSAENENSSDNFTSDSEHSLFDIEAEMARVNSRRCSTNRKKRSKKAGKSPVLPQRLTPEELERRKEQLIEHDRVIAQFFEQFACPKCNFILENFSALRQHFRSEHPEELGYMNCCGRKYSQRKTLAEHIYVHWNPEHFKCANCARTFQDSRTLEAHAQTHVENTDKDKKMFQCDKCPRSFTTKAAFEYHNFNKHTPRSEFKYNCTECNKKLPTERKLKNHMKYMHDPETAIICDKCGKQMRSQSNLKKHHQLEHSDVPRPIPVPMQCEICGTWLRHLSGLKQHMKTIHEDTGGEHRCHICNKTSTNARALKRHIYHNHECERKFKCTMCEKAFKRPQDLKEHTSTHTGEVLYTCPNCPMTFFSNANMYKHRQRLHRAEYEADRKKPGPQNIRRQAMAATAAMKMQQALGATSAFFARSNESKI